MAKIKYSVHENTKVGTHSFYAVPQPNGTLDFDEVCEEACTNTSIEPSIMRAAVTEYMKVVKRNVLKGFRVSVGEQFLFVYPNLMASVKDKKDAQGNVIKAVTVEDFSLTGAKSRLGASVSKNFSAEFANKVSWQRVDAKTGLPVEEDITDNGGGGGGTNNGDDDFIPGSGGGENTGGNGTLVDDPDGD